ncbi:MAG TPA: hypothetical protein VNC78_04790 [Actinomycetota bacterium]|nr:hypothetical protein [Actinomycetota bacterium]
MASFGDRIRGFFNRKNNPALGELEVFAAERKGIEGFIEPQTSTSPTTLLLVDRNGEHLRAAVREPSDAVAFCETRGIPVYDALVMGYPQRMKDFERRRKSAALEDLDEQIEDLERRLSEEPPGGQ